MGSGGFVAPTIRRPRPRRPAVRAVPVTVVGGFLGAGKTSLVRHLLTGDHGLRLAVVVNDVGAINIDAALVADTESERIELTNGCSCCSLGPDLARSLHDLAHRPDPPDAIIIEASGVGGPDRDRDGDRREPRSCTRRHPHGGRCVHLLPTPDRSRYRPPASTPARCCPSGGSQQVRHLDPRRCPSSVRPRRCRRPGATRGAGRARCPRPGHRALGGWQGRPPRTRSA